MQIASLQKTVQFTKISANSHTQLQWNCCHLQRVGGNWAQFGYWCRKTSICNLHIVLTIISSYWIQHISGQKRSWYRCVWSPTKNLKYRTIISYTAYLSYTECPVEVLGSSPNILSIKHFISCILVNFNTLIYGVNVLIYVKENTKFRWQVTKSKNMR